MKKNGLTKALDGVIIQKLSAKAGSDTKGSRQGNEKKFSKST